jgi:uncharacterized alkaline shock family protein YloU
MEVLALVGASGTGKSYRAILVAHEHEIDTIIDDGLLIEGSHILAGASAKRQPTKIGAIRTALFSEPEHALEVKNKIFELNPSRILILGTSIGMVERITKQLNLPAPVKIIRIEDVATPREIYRAQMIRKKYGKHVVPAPTVEVKPKLSGIITDPLKTLLHRRQASLEKRPLWIEQTVVRPTFNYLGRFYITNGAIGDIIKGTVAGLPGLAKILQVNTNNRPEGVIINIEAEAVYGVILPQLMTTVQNKIKEKVGQMTALNILAVNIYVKRLLIKEEFNSPGNA